MENLKFFLTLLLVSYLCPAACSFRQIATKKSNEIIQEVSHFELPNKLEVAIFHSPFVSDTQVSLNHRISRVDEEIPGLSGLYIHLTCSLNNSVHNKDFEDWTRSGNTQQHCLQFEFKFKSSDLKKSLRSVASHFINPNFYIRDNIDKDLAEAINNVEKEIREREHCYEILDHMAGKIQGFPSSSFHLNSHQPLPNIKKESLTSALRTFYEKNISSDKMKLVILTPKPVKKIQKYVIRYFSKIPFHRNAVTTMPEYKSGQMIEFISQRPNNMFIELPISLKAGLPHHQRLIEYFIYLLGSRTKGSWLELLGNQLMPDGFDIKYEVWGDCLCVVILLVHFRDPNQDTFQHFIAAFQKYLNFLTINAADFDLYQEFKSDIKKRNVLKAIEFNSVDEISEQMQYNQHIYDWYSCEEMEFDADSISQLMQGINPASINIVMGWKLLQDFGKFIPTSPVPYRFSTINFDPLLINFDYQPQLPTENKFSSSPELKFLQSTNTNKKFSRQLNPFLWFSDNFSILSTQSIINIRLFFLDIGLKHRIMIGIFFEIIKKHLSIEIDQAQRAGLRVEIKVSNFHSIDISIYGFGGKAPKKFLRCFLKTFENFLNTDSDSWEAWRSSFEKLSHLLIPYSDYSSPSSTILQFFNHKVSWGEQDDTLEALKIIIEEITFDEFKMFVIDNEIPKWLSLPHVFVAGVSLKESHARDIQTLTTRVFYSQLPGNEIQNFLNLLNGPNRFQVGSLYNSKCFFREFQPLLPMVLLTNSVCLMVLSPAVGQFDLYNNIFALLFCRVFSGLFSDKLGPKENWAFSPRLTIIGLSQGKISLYFYLNTAAPKEKLLAHVLGFLGRDIFDYLDSTSDQFLLKIFESLKEPLLKPDDRFYTQAQMQWFSLSTFEIDHGIANFFTNQYSVGQFRSDVKKLMLSSQLRIFY
jgi:hypothetical protein